MNRRDAIKGIAGVGAAASLSVADSPARPFSLPPPPPLLKVGSILIATSSVFAVQYYAPTCLTLSYDVVLEALSHVWLSGFDSRHPIPGFCAKGDDAGALFDSLVGKEGFVRVGAYAIRLASVIAVRPSSWVKGPAADIFSVGSGAGLAVNSDDQAEIDTLVEAFKAYHEGTD